MTVKEMCFQEIGGQAFPLFTWFPVAVFSEVKAATWEGFGPQGSATDSS